MAFWNKSVDTYGQAEIEAASAARQQRLAAVAAEDAAKSKYMKETLTTREITDLFEESIQLVDEIGNESRLAESILLLKSLPVLWWRVDRTLLTDQELQHMYNILFTDLPKAVQQIRAGLFSAYENSSNIHYAIEAVSQLMYDLEELRISSSGKSALARLQPATATPSALTIAAFPSLLQKTAATQLSSHSELDSQFKRIMMLWEKNSAGATTIEDDHFLKEMVGSYLPSAFDLYESFIIADKERKEAALQILCDQFNLLEAHLTKMITRKLDADLLRFRSQTLFLEDKTAVLELETNAFALQH